MNSNRNIVLSNLIYLHPRPQRWLTQALADGTNNYLYALGSVRQRSDSNSALTLGKSYEPYGDKVTAQDSSSTYAYMNEWTDGTGIINLRARYMNTGAGWRSSANKRGIPW